MAEAKQTSLDPGTLDLIRSALASGGTGAISAPQGQENIVIKNDKFDPQQPISEANSPIITVASPNAAPKPSTAAPTHFGSDTTGYWVVDPTAPNGVRMVVPPHTPNADEEMKKALDRVDRQQEMAAKQRNEVATGIYGTDAEVQQIRTSAAKDKLDAATLQQRISEFNTQHKYDDQNQKIADDKAASDLQTAVANRAATAASTAGTQASTAATQQATDIAGKKLPGELAQQGATLEGTQAATAGTQASTARTQQEIAQGKAPTVQTPQTGMYTWQRDPITGAVTQGGINPEYLPKTQTEIAARVGQINDLANAKSKEVQARVGQIVDGKQYTADDALKEFNSWYDSNVAPQTGALQAAQQAAAFDQAKQQADMQRQAYSTALGAGTQAISAFTASQNDRVGPGWEAANKAASSGDFNALGNVGNAVSYQAPDVSQTANDAVMNALKYISPTAANATGTPLPNFQSIDINSNLDRLKYMPGGQPVPLPQPQPVPVGAGGPPPAAAPPATGQPFDWSALFGRLGSDVADQRVQAGIGGQWTPPGGSGYMNAGPPPWAGAQPQTLQQQYGTANPWPDYTYG
jgi:hypothetical protein